MQCSSWRKTAAAGRGISPDDGVLLAEGYHIPEKFKNFFVFFQQRPVQPGYFIILAVGIVVSKLRVSEFITGKEHGGPPAAHKNGAGIFYHAETQIHDFFIVCRAFITAVPAPVIIGAVRIVPAICLIMFGTIG